MKVLFKVASLAVVLAFLNLEPLYSHEVKRHLLKNGLTVLVEESRKAPLVAIEAQVKTGSATEYDYLGSGLSHFVEHMLFKGTVKWPRPGGIAREIKSLGGYINGFTSHDSTGVNIIVPSVHVNKALEILSDVLTSSLFDINELEKERGVILKELRLNNDEPSKYLSRLLWSNMFKRHNYRFPVIGYEELLKKLKREDLLRYYKTNYIPDSIVLGIVGDIDANETFKTVEALFGNIERASPPQTYSQQEPQQIMEFVMEEERALALTYLSMGFHSVSIRDKDVFDLDVLSMILGSGEDSRLSKVMCKQKKLVYSIGSFNYTPMWPGIFAITAVLKNENVPMALEEIWNQIQRLKVNLVSDKELKKAKNAVLTGYIFSRQTVQERASALVGGEVIAGDYDFSRKYVEGINGVTKNSVREAAKRYLRREDSTLIRLVPKAVKKAKEKDGALAERDLIEKFELKNNLKVLILEDRSLPIISLHAIGLGGLRTENLKNNGISSLVSETLLCGTRTRSEEEIFSQIEGSGATLNSFSGSNTFGISATGLSNDLDLILQLFSDVLQHPEFAEDKIERETAIAGAKIKATSDDLYKSGMRTLKYTLFRKHPYRYQALGRPSTIKRLSKNELSGYHKTYYTPQNMIFTIAGDIDKKIVKEKIIGLFERLEKGPPVKIEPPKEKKRRHPRTLTRETEREESLIMLGYPGTTIYSHDKYVLDVLSSILSGINGRLSKAVREEKGLAYALNVMSLPGIEPGICLFYIGTTKENLEAAKNELFKEIGRLKKEGIDEDELKSARRELIGLHKMGLQTIQDTAMKVSIDELYGLGYDNFLTYETRVNHITKECVIRAARKYLSDNSYVLLTIRGAG